MLVSRRKFAAIFASVALLPAAAVLADDDDDDEGKGRGRRGRGKYDDDHDEAYEARKAGDILPLSEILTVVRSRFPGEVVGIEFEVDEGIPVYEIKVLEPDGRYLEIELDARTARVLKTEGE